MAALVVDNLPEGPEWLYELKFDGYRALLIKHEEMVRLHSRKDKDLTALYPGIAEAGEHQALSIAPRIIDLHEEILCTVRPG